MYSATYTRFVNPYGKKLAGINDSLHILLGTVHRRWYSPGHTLFHPNSSPKLAQALKIDLTSTDRKITILAEKHHPRLQQPACGNGQEA